LRKNLLGNCNQNCILNSKITQLVNESDDIFYESVVTSSPLIEEEHFAGISRGRKRSLVKIISQMIIILFRRLSELLLSTAGPHQISGQVLSSHSIVSSSSTVRP